MTALLWILGGSCVLSLVLTPIARNLALRFGLVDRPDGRRKIHCRPVPRAGGLAVLASTIVVLLIALLAPTPLRDDLLAKGNSLCGLLLAALIIALVGVADDYGLL